MTVEEDIVYLGTAHLIRRGSKLYVLPGPGPAGENQGLNLSSSTLPTYSVLTVDLNDGVVTKSKWGRTTGAKPPPVVTDLKAAVERIGAGAGVAGIAAERMRQIEDFDYDDDHDDEHYGGELAVAAASYAYAAAQQPQPILVSKPIGLIPHFKSPWPWTTSDDPAKRRQPGNASKDQPAYDIRLLEKAGALCAAEIERKLRTQARVS